MRVRQDIKERIISTANALTAEGIESPTNEQVRERMGGGSLSHISPMMREWRESRKSEVAAALEIPADLKKVIETSLGQVWTTANKLASASIETVRQDADAGIEAATAERDEALEEIRRLEERLGQLEEAVSEKDQVIAARHNDQRQLNTCEGPVALIDAKGLVHASTPVFRDLVAQEWGRPAARRLPEAVNENLWCEGVYRSAFLSLSTEPSGVRLLVRICYTPPQPLSPREMEITVAYAHGQSYKEVAQDLGLSPTTVRSHLSRAYQKLSIRDKGALATWLSYQS